MNAFLLLTLAAYAATADAPRVIEAPRPLPRPAPARPAAAPARPATRPRPALPARSGELRRLRADLSGRITARVKARAEEIRARRSGAEARRRYAALRATLGREEAELKLDRAHAFSEFLKASEGSPEQEAWRTAAAAGTVMLEDCASARAALDAVAAR